MKILCLTHADFEGPGILEIWAKQHKHDFKICKPYQGENCLLLPESDVIIHWLIPLLHTILSELDHYDFMAFKKDYFQINVLKNYLLKVLYLPVEFYVQKIIR